MNQQSINEWILLEEISSHHPLFPEKLFIMSWDIQQCYPHSLLSLLSIRQASLNYLLTKVCEIEFVFNLQFPWVVCLINIYSPWILVQLREIMYL